MTSERIQMKLIKPFQLRFIATILLAFLRSHKKRKFHDSNRSIAKVAAATAATATTTTSNK